MLVATMGSASGGGLWDASRSGISSSFAGPDAGEPADESLLAGAGLPLIWGDFESGTKVATAMMAITAPTSRKSQTRPAFDLFVRSTALGCGRFITAAIHERRFGDPHRKRATPHANLCLYPPSVLPIVMEE
jgi:hypothetical protein